MRSRLCEDENILYNKDSDNWEIIVDKIITLKDIKTRESDNRYSFHRYEDDKTIFRLYNDEQLEINTFVEVFKCIVEKHVGDNFANNQ